MHERLTNLRPVIFVQIAHGTPRTEVWRALHGASTLMSNCGKIVVAVSDDIDPASVDAVLWSLAYRSNPIEDVQLVPYRGGVQGAQYGPEQSDSSMLIDATRKRPMAPLALPTREHMEHARELWERLGLHPLTVTSPWHGYHLGDWTETWEKFAKPRRRRRLGDFRPRDARPPARRRDAGDLGAGGGEAERVTRKSEATGPMARVPYFDRSGFTRPSIRICSTGRSICFGLWSTVRAPRAAGAGLGHYIRHGSKLDPRLRELAILQVGYLARSPYEYSHHVKIGRDFGVSDDDIRAIAAETAGRASALEPLAKTVLKAAREMSTELAISDSTFAQLRDKLDTERLTDLV